MLVLIELSVLRSMPVIRPLMLKIRLLSRLARKPSLLIELIASIGSNRNCLGVSGSTLFGSNVVDDLSWSDICWLKSIVPAGTRWVVMIRYSSEGLKEDGAVTWTPYGAATHSRAHRDEQGATSPDSVGCASTLVSDSSVHDFIRSSCRSASTAACRCALRGRQAVRTGRCRSRHRIRRR